MKISRSESEEENLGSQMWDFVRKPLHNEINAGGKRGTNVRTRKSRCHNGKKGYLWQKRVEDGATVCAILKIFSSVNLLPSCFPSFCEHPRAELQRACTTSRLPTEQVARRTQPLNPQLFFFLRKRGCVISLFTPTTRESPQWSIEMENDDTTKAKGNKIVKKDGKIVKVKKKK